MKSQPCFQNLSHFKKTVLYGYRESSKFQKLCKLAQSSGHRECLVAVSHHHITIAQQCKFFILLALWSTLWKLHNEEFLCLYLSIKNRCPLFLWLFISRTYKVLPLTYVLFIWGCHHLNHKGKSFLMFQVSVKHLLFLLQFWASWMYV